MIMTMRKMSLLQATALGATLCSPAYAQAGPEDRGGASDIVVTARRVEERLQDVPISITVFNQQQISDRNVVTATDLATYTPSLSVNSRFGPEKSSFAIRGFVQEAATAPSVGVYFAEAVAPNANGGTTSGNNAPVGSFMDLQNVQVLKGPQGTLFGRNTTGGAVLLVPKKPTDRLEGYVQASAGDYGMWRGEGVLNVPLADTFKVRIAVDRNKRDGYMKNHAATGPDYNDVNYFAGRLSIVADLTPDLENYTVATYSNSFSHGYAGRLGTCLFNGIVPANGTLPAFALSAAQNFTAGAACAQIARQSARGDGPWDVEVSIPDPYIKLRVWQIINTTTWRASDTLTIKNIASYGELRERANFSLDSDNFSQPASGPYTYIYLSPKPGGNNAAQSTFTEELQFQGKTSDGSLDWQAGGYLSTSDPIGFNTGYSSTFLNCSNQQLLQCSNPLGAGSIQDSATKFWFRTKALYAQGTYHFTSRLSVTGGIRYTWDETRALGQTTRIRFLPGSAGIRDRICNDVVRFFSGTPGTPLVVTDASRCAFEPTPAKSDRPTWLIDLDYKPSEDTLVYAKYARGYRQGGLNMTSVGLEGWGPEKVDAYELGAKLSFRGSVSGYFNIAGFYNDFTNQQINVNGISNVVGFNGSQPTVNAGKSRIQGVEVDASATFLSNFRLDAGYTFLDTKLQSITLPAIPPGAPYAALIPNSVVGGPLALSPKHRLTLTGTFTLPIPDDVGRVSLSATYIYTSSQYATRADDTIIWSGAGCPVTPPSTTPQCSVSSASVFGFNPGLLPASNLVNLNVNWDNVMGKPVDLSFFVTNLTNEAVKTNVGSAFNSAGYEAYFYGPPRMFGFRIKYRFGD
jgi:iron complex outermembrane receptor protein